MGPGSGRGAYVTAAAGASRLMPGVSTTSPVKRQCGSWPSCAETCNTGAPSAASEREPLASSHPLMCGGRHGRVRQLARTGPRSARLRPRRVAVLGRGQPPRPRPRPRRPAGHGGRGPGGGPSPAFPSGPSAPATCSRPPAWAVPGGRPCRGAAPGSSSSPRSRPKGTQSGRPNRVREGTAGGTGPGAHFWAAAGGSGLPVSKIALQFRSSSSHHPSTTRPGCPTRRG